jgi:hypothetical protein
MNGHFNFHYDENLARIGWLDEVAQAQYSYSTNNGTITINTYVGHGGALVIPSTINGLPVTTLGNNVFTSRTNLTSVIIPKTVTNIGDLAFFSCSGLTNLTLPGSVTSIGQYAFQYCSKLTAVFCLSNAPATAPNAFSGNTVATIYYLPGTIGWEATLGGRPTALWNPAIQTTGPGFGVINSQFGFTITGTPNIPIVIEASTNCAPLWTPLQSSTLTNGSIHFTDPAWSNYTTRFYRLRSP